jgi:hypothetical protein
MPRGGAWHVFPSATCAHRGTHGPPAPALVHTVNSGPGDPRWRRDRRVAWSWSGFSWAAIWVLPENEPLLGDPAPTKNPLARYFNKTA